MSRGTGEASQTDPSKPDVRATSTQGIARSARRGSLMRSTTKSPTCSSLGGADGIVEVVAQSGTSVEGVEADAGGGKRRPVHAPKGRQSTRGDCGGGPTYLVGFLRGNRTKARRRRPLLWESPTPPTLWSLGNGLTKPRRSPGHRGVWSEDRRCLRGTKGADGNGVSLLLRRWTKCTTEPWASHRRPGRRSSRRSDPPLVGDAGCRTLCPRVQSSVGWRARTCHGVLTLRTT